MSLENNRAQLRRIFKILDQMSGFLPYVGLVLIGFLILQTRTSSIIAEKTLEETIATQESLRNTLWTNLLLQRITVLAESSKLKNNPELLDRAIDIAQSAPGFLFSNDARSPEEDNLAKEMTDLEVFLREAVKSPSQKSFSLSKEDPIIRLIDKVDTFGTVLNAKESENWFNLKENNKQNLDAIRKKKAATYITYSVFIFYMLMLMWILHRKKVADLFLKQSERRMRALVEATYESILIIQNSRIIEVNPAFESTFSVSASQAIGKEIFDFIELAVNDRGPEKVFDIDLLAGKEAVGICSNNLKIPIEVSVKNSDFEDLPIKIISIRDLTNKKESENLKFEKEAAERANRAKSSFLANMSHELRTPMHGVLSFARFGLRDSKGEPFSELASHFQEIFDSGSRLMQLLDDLLDLAKLEAGKMSYAMGSSDFVSVCRQIIEEQRAFAEEKNLKVQLHQTSQNELIAMFDHTRMAQVLRNIITNAIKFSNSESEILVCSKIESDFLVCEVSNRGKEIPEEELKRIFDKFVQSSRTKSGAGGTGLGLAICKEIVEQHHGEIWAESSDGQTKFVFKIPIEQPIVSIDEPSVA